MTTACAAMRRAISVIAGVQPASPLMSSTTCGVDACGTKAVPLPTCGSAMRRSSHARTGAAGREEVWAATVGTARPAAVNAQSRSIRARAGIAKAM